MLKYGKRKGSLLPSFPSIRDLSMTSRSTTSKNRGSPTLASAPGQDISNPIASHHDNTIDEMASMLLGDTTTINDPTKRVAVQHVGSPADKALPQLPELLFNGDDAWAQKTTPVVTAAGKLNEIHFPENSVVANNSSSRMFGQSADYSTPPIPRKSSKRNSTRPKNVVSEDEDGLLKSRQSSALSPARSTRGTIYPDQATMINAKLAGVLSFTAALKPDAGNFLQGPLVPTKKRRLKDNKVIAKMRTAINGRLTSRGDRKRHDSVRDDHLLDQSLNELHDEEDLSNAVSNIDIRLNEGFNFNKNPKVFVLTGHGNVARKPVPDDGASVRTRKSNSTDPFSSRPGSSGITRTPTHFERSLKDDMSVDPSAEIIPDLPTSRPQSSRESVLRGKKSRSSLLATTSFETERFDALLTSSPLAQSTPRIRLEPTLEENGRRTLKNVPADSRSLFDQDTSSVMDVDSTPSKPQTGESSIKRKSSILRESAFGFRYHSKRTKKHPSPSKAELEGMGKVLQQYPPELFIRADTIEHQEIPDSSPADVGNPTPTPILALKDPNPKMKATVKPTEKRRGIGLFPKSQLSRSGTSMPDIPRRPKTSKSLIPKPTEKGNTKPRQDSRSSSRDDLFNGAAMEIDELQWDKSEFGIQMNKA